MSEMITLKDLSELTDIPIRKILYRIKTGDIKAEKLGWIWVVPKTEIEKLKKVTSRGGG